MLKLERVHIGYEHTLFDLHSINIEPGSFVGIIGANGTGKSTFLNTLINPEEQQQIQFNQNNWTKLSVKERSYFVTLIDNHFLGFPNLSTQEYIEFGRIPHTGITGILSPEDQAIVTKNIQRFNLEQLANKPTSSLSDGERQRAGLARALVQETPLILLDEPTAFLDYPTKKEVMQLLRKITLEEQKIILMSSHDLEFCLNFCTHLLIIRPNQKASYIPATITFDKLISRAFPSL